MIMAFLIWFLEKFGVAPTPEDVARMDREFRERGHHVTLDFAGTRFGGTRWSDDDFQKLLTIGLGYEYLVDRSYHGVGIEFLGQVLGPVLRPDKERHEYFVGAGLAYYPVRNLRLYMQAGPRILDDGDVQALGRIGAGYRFMFFAVGIQPHAFVQTTTTGDIGWGLGARFEY